jgi:hypothetical protein
LRNVQVEFLESLNFVFSFVDFNLLLEPFLLSSSLGADLGKWTRKPLGAHQERILIAMKENTAVFFYRPNYEPFIVSYVGNLTS